jgi:glycosyltransferase involved in cell wall biosynthesis
LISPPRVALFTDSFYEANGVATLSRHLVEFARSRDFPLLIVRGGDQTALTHDGSVQTLELKRGFASFPVDKSLYCDPLLTRYKRLVIDQLLAFKPDLVHMTGPGDLGFLALLTSHSIHVPLVASWHTNLHEYLARRLDRVLRFLPASLRNRATSELERHSLRGLLRFYRTARYVLAPNQTLVNLLEARNNRPAFLMPHGVDLSGYSPVAKPSGDRPFCIGYVGRLTTEKNIRCLVDLEQKLIAAGEKNYQFLIVGEGGQQAWLRRHLQRAEITGVLRGQELAAAYQRMDAFVFPSLTDTFGLVILEAMASGVPVILAPETGRRVGIVDGVSGFLSDDFAASMLQLMHNRALLESMAAAARHFAKINSWEGVFEQLYHTYQIGLDISNTRRAEREARAVGV